MVSVGPRAGPPRRRSTGWPTSAPNAVEAWFLRNAGVPVARGGLVVATRVWLVLFVLQTATESADRCGLLYPGLHVGQGPQSRVHRRGVPVIGGNGIGA